MADEADGYGGVFRRLLTLGGDELGAEECEFGRGEVEV